ncbi:hypothetical protein U1Q18_006878 [Sarracenia purpurea var. burkii]
MFSMPKKMKIHIIKAFFLIFLFAFHGTQARIVPEYLQDELMKNDCGRILSPTTLSLVSSPPSREITSISHCEEKKSRYFFARKCDYEGTSRPPPPSPRSPSGPIQMISSPIAFTCDEGHSCNFISRMTNYGRASSPPPPSPKLEPPIEDISTVSASSLRRSPPRPPKATPIFKIPRLLPYTAKSGGHINLVKYKISMKSPPNPTWLAST